MTSVKKKKIKKKEKERKEPVENDTGFLFYI
jgi:hypothetical protein